MREEITDRPRLFDVLRHAKREEWCCHCRFWDSDFAPAVHTDFPSQIEYDGWCRRYPPEQTPTYGRWPITAYADWCGEYQLKPVPHLAQYIEELSRAQPADQQP